MTAVENSHYHHGSPVLGMGSDLQNAKSAMILLHGRGASAEDIMGVGREFTLPKDMLVLAPQARSNVWYPQPLTAPLEANEPYLSSAIARVNELVDTLAKNDIPSEKVIIAGFSQGASLSIEFVLRSGRRWGGLLAFSGGYIWPIGKAREPHGDLQGTPVLLACSDVDPFIPLQRVDDTAALLQAMGAQVTKLIYAGMDHTIVKDEIERAQKFVSALE